VAIVTGRESKDTRYEEWVQQSREAFDEGAKPSPNAPGEWAALCGQLLRSWEANKERDVHHVFYQLDALTAQTRRPDEVLVIDRQLSRYSYEDVAEYLMDRSYPFYVRWMQPALRGLELSRSSTAGQPTFMVDNRDGDGIRLPVRDTKIPYGNADKNTAIEQCGTPGMVMLDDCCLPGFGLCAAAEQAILEKSILMLRHVKVNLDGSIAVANEEATNSHKVFGIWAMPVEFVRAVNGYNTSLDGQRADWDQELLDRMLCYTQSRGISIVYNRAATVYEIEHDYPWEDMLDEDMPERRTKGWRAPEPIFPVLNEDYLYGDSQAHTQEAGFPEEEDDYED